MIGPGIKYGRTIISADGSFNLLAGEEVVAISSDNSRISVLGSGPIPKTNDGPLPIRPPINYDTPPVPTQTPTPNG